MECRNSNHLNASPAARPTVPPKPKSQSKSTVGIQVNLRRKTSPSIRNEDDNSNSTIESSPNQIVTSNNNLSTNDRLRKSSCPDNTNLTPKSSVKPALPPKPATGSTTSPKKSLQTPSTPPRKENQIAQSTAQPLSPSAEGGDPLKKLSPNSFRQKTSPVSPTKPKFRQTPFSPLLASPKPITTPVNSKSPVFQFPSAAFLSPSQRAEFSRKSTSLGRNFDIANFSKDMKKSSMSRVTPLDLSSCTNKPASLPPSFGKAITFAPANKSPQPPPAPPRRKRSSVSSPTSPEPTSPKPMPVYAKVDIEKKWETRRLKASQGKEDDNEGNSDHEHESYQNQSLKDGQLKDQSEDPQITSRNAYDQSEPTLLKDDEATSSASIWLTKFMDSMASNSDPNNTRENEVVSATLDRIAKQGEEHSQLNVVTESINACANTNEEADKSLRENDSFLFQHVEQEKSQEMKNDNTPVELKSEEEIKVSQCANVTPTEENKHSDSFESEFEHKLEKLPLNQHGKEILNAEKEDSATKNENSQSSHAIICTLIGESTQLTDPSNILQTADMQLQNLKSLLSDISRNSADTGIGSENALNSMELKEGVDAEDAALVSRIVLDNFGKSHSKDSGDGSETVKCAAHHLQLTFTSPTAHQKSWNSSDTGSTSSDTPSSCSSSLRDRTSIAASCSHESSWVDEGEISTGALGDLDSDAPPKEGGTHPGAISRRKRIASMFSSFGKTNSGSSSSNNGHGPSRHTPRKPKPQFGEASGFGPKVMSEAVISHPYSVQSVPSHPHKTQSLPGFDYHVKQPLASPESTARSSTVDSFSGSSVTQEEKDGSGSSTSVCSLYNEILMELAPKEKKIFQVAREILTTERTFVDVLNLLTVDFPNALREASIHPLVSDYDLNFILGGLPQLKNVNLILLSDLEERIRGWRSNPKVADIFVKKGPFLKHYSTYIRDFKANLDYFEDIRKKYPKFDKTISEFEHSDLCHKLGLRHYMLKPVQRMPQYALLLEEYLKNLDENCEDYQDTLKAITIVRDVAEHANHAIWLKENGDQMKRLQERLVHNNEILKADRQIIKEGSLEKVCRKGYQPRYFALMSDCLLCMMFNTTAGSNRDLKLRYELSLTGMKVHPTASEDRPNEFSVLSTTRSFNLVARTDKEREDWLVALEKAIHTNIKKRACSTPDMEKEFEIGKAAPVWIQDTRVTMCQSCTAEFTITFRRHHCRACGKVVCGNCSGNEAPLQYLKSEAARVCDDCYQNLLEVFDREQRSVEEPDSKLEEIRTRFKKTTPNVTKRYRHKKSIPQRLEVNSASSTQISGYLHWREKKSWKRRWFVLSDNVLYVCMASEDVVAYKTIPILGYDVEVMSEKTYEGVDGRFVFKLTHSGQNPMIFQADSASAVEKWVALMKDATVLT